MMRDLSTRRRTVLGLSSSGRTVQIIFVGIVALLLQTLQSSRAASATWGSMKAELFHRDHPFSRVQPTRPLSNAEKLQSEGKRTALRAQALASRRLTSEVQEYEPRTYFTSTWQTPLTNAAQSEYLMQISLGTPAQTFVAVADTGSDLTWLQCAPCENCFPQVSPIFQPSLSSTYQNLSCASMGCESLVLQYGSTAVSSCDPNCQYQYFYGDGSNTTGTFAAETITVTSINGNKLSVPDFWFGCSHASVSTSPLFDNTDGLVGLGQGLISFPSQLGQFFDDKFSYCLVNRSLAAVQSSLLMFGREAAPDFALQYTPIISNPVYPFYYYIGIEGISVAGTAVEYNMSALELDCSGNGGTILDSGATFSSLDPRAFAPLMAAIVTAVPESLERVTLPPDFAFWNLCYDITGSPTYEMPVISFKLANNTAWDLSAENSWVILEGIPDVPSLTLCLAITPGFEGDFSIIGNYQQLDFHVLFDRQEQKIGFASTDCGSVAP